MRRTGKLAILVALGLLAGCGPKLDGLEKGEKGRVAQVLDGDTLLLDGGLRVTLTGIEAPFGDQPFAREARAGLERLALHRPALLAYGGVKRLPARTPKAQPVDGASGTPSPAPPPAEPPRSETALAQVFAQSEGGRWIWVQQAMVQEGLARVRTRKENHARAAELLAAEAQARRARRGLWGQAAYRVLTAEAAIAKAADLPSRCGQGPFWVVEGTVRDVSATPERVYLNFGADYRSDFTVAVYGEDVADWTGDQHGPAFESYEGRKVRVRGRAANRGGPLICADHPAQIEMLEG
ncbi:MAG: thermonuclease family protein [Hyphomonadaceae bacterium]|nr:thermonuclease family protein [Hyphomonadaceae bacterium]